MTEKLLRRPQVIEITGFPTSTIYAKIKQLRFPRQYKFGGSACWKMSEIQEYISIGEDNYHRKLLENGQKNE